MPTRTEAIPRELRDLQRWVGRDAAVAESQGLNGKTPLCVFRNGAASVSNPATWGSFEEARECIERGIYEHVGFVFADDGLVGIDIDKGVAFGEDGLPSADAIEAIMACASYTELSQSNRAFHIICRGTLPFGGRNNGRGWEIYRAKRYFVLTGNTLLYDAIADAQEGIDLVLRRHFPDAPREGSDSGRRTKIWEPRWVLPSGGHVMVEPERDPVPAGSRHISMVSYCGQLHSCLAHKSVVLKLALETNERYMDPPLPVPEVESIVNSVTRYRR